MTGKSAKWVGSVQSSGRSSRIGNTGPSENVAAAVMLHSKWFRRTRACATSVVVVCSTLVLAPTSTADTTEDLKAAVDAARSATGCPPFQFDAILNEVSQRAVRESDGWVSHTGKVLPVSDTNVQGVPSVTQALRDVGYNPSKVRMLSGYGDANTGGHGGNETKAVTAVVLQGLGFEVFSDCGYTKYGFGALSNDSSQGWPSAAPRSYSVTAVVVAGD